VIAKPFSNEEMMAAVNELLSPNHAREAKKDEA
jgi:DNA-binding response OmpR family regulator